MPEEVPGDMQTDRSRKDQVSASSSDANIRDPSASVAAPTRAKIVSHLSAGLAPFGLDFVHSFDVHRYNAAVQGHRSLLELPGFGRTTALAVLIANSRALWSPFLAAMRDTVALREAADPLDAYVESSVRSVVAELTVRHEVYFASERELRRVSMLHAADASGFARRSPMHLAVHPTLGPWFGLRALLVFDVEATERGSDRPSPCVGCAMPCALPLQQALAEYRRLGEASVKSGWSSWLAVRDACPIGREHRYDAEQIHYHYTKDRSALARLL